MSEIFYGLNEAADLLGFSEQSVRRWVRSGELPAYKLGKEYRISQEDLDSFLEARRTAGPKAPPADTGPEPPPRSVGEQLRDNPEAPVNLPESWKHELSQGGPERPPVLISLSRLDNKIHQAPPSERLGLIDRLLDEESSETNRYWLRSRRDRVSNGTYRPMRPDPQTPEEAGREAQELLKV